MTELYNSNAWPIFEMIFFIGVASAVVALAIKAISVIANYRSNKNRLGNVE